MGEIVPFDDERAREIGVAITRLRQMIGALGKVIDQFSIKSNMGSPMSDWWKRTAESVLQTALATGSEVFFEDERLSGPDRRLLLIYVGALTVGQQVECISGSDGRRHARRIFAQARIADYVGDAKAVFDELFMSEKIDAFSSRARRIAEAKRALDQSNPLPEPVTRDRPADLAESIERADRIADGLAAVVGLIDSSQLDRLGPLALGTASRVATEVILLALPTLEQKLAPSDFELLRLVRLCREFGPRLKFLTGETRDAHRIGQRLGAELVSRAGILPKLDEDRESSFYGVLGITDEDAMEESRLGSELRRAVGLVERALEFVEGPPDLGS